MYGVPRPDPDTPLSTELAAQAAGVTTNRIRAWRTKGWKGLDGQPKKLPVAGHDERGFPLHRYRDVLEAERETSANTGKSHRRLGPPQPLNLPEVRLKSVADWATLDRAS